MDDEGWAPDDLSPKERQVWRLASKMEDEEGGGPPYYSGFDYAWRGYQAGVAAEHARWMGIVNDVEGQMIDHHGDLTVLAVCAVIRGRGCPLAREDRNSQATSKSQVATCDLCGGDGFIETSVDSIACNCALAREGETDG